MEILKMDASNAVMRQYCLAFIDVLKAGFGKDKDICATVYTEEEFGVCQPTRLVAFYLQRPSESLITYEPIRAEELTILLSRLLESDYCCEGVPDSSYAVLASYKSEGESTPMVYYIKPNEYDYWSVEEAREDAYELSAGICLAGERG